MHHVEQEVLAGDLGVIDRNRGGVDHDVVAEEVGQDGEAAGRLHAELIDTGAGRGLDERLADVHLVDDVSGSVSGRPDSDLERYGTERVLVDGE